jgi:dinuclear metal center YbgI/SA1388 family protein
MTVRDIRRILDAWAPRELAWERDNPGLQCGDPGTTVSKILVALDLNTDVVNEARRRGANLIITHHPLLFHPLRSVDTTDRIGGLVALLLRYNIAHLAVHTNADFTEGGVSMLLAAKLSLTNTEVLLADKKPYRKLVVFVPDEHADDVRTAMAAAGAGKIGRYDSCSFGSDGTGTFRPLAGADPHIGTIGTVEHVRERRIEMILPEWRVSAVVAAMRAAHPYEEAAYDIIPIENTAPGYGAGAIGNLEKPMTTAAFLRHVRLSLGIPFLRYSGTPAQKIGRVAVCGGSGSDLTGHAIRCGADAFVTADISYHRFEEAAGRILLVDGGHYETEIPVVEEIVHQLGAALGGAGSAIPVFATKKTTNPVRYHLS